MMEVMKDKKYITRRLSKKAQLMQYSIHNAYKVYFKCLHIRGYLGNIYFFSEISV